MRGGCRVKPTSVVSQIDEKSVNLCSFESIDHSNNISLESIEVFWLKSAHKHLPKGMVSGLLGKNGE